MRRAASTATSSSREGSDTASTSAGSARVRLFPAEPGQGLHQPRLAVRDVLAPPLDQPVGEGDDRVAGRERHHDPVAGEAAHAQRSALGERELGDLAVGVQEQRRRVPRVAHQQLAAPGVGHGVQQRHQLFGVEVRVHLVQPGEHDGGVRVEDGVRTDGGAGLGHRGGRLDPAAHDVPDEQDQAIPVELQHVVEVPADLGPARRAVEVCDLPAGRGVQRLREHGLLELHRRRHRLAVQVGVVDRHRGALGHGLRELEVVLGEVPPGLRRHPGEDAQHAPAGDERDDDDAA